MILAIPQIVLSANFSEALVRRALLEVTDFFMYFLSPDFHNLCRGRNDCPSFTEVEQQWDTLVLGWVTTSVHYLCL